MGTNMSYKEEYLEENGHHFNKKLFEYAVQRMVDRNGNKIAMMTKEQVSEALRLNNVALKNDVGYDAAYVMHMAKADYYGSSIVDDIHLAKFVKDYLDDPDGNPCRAFDEFWINLTAKGEHIYWEDFL